MSQTVLADAQFSIARILRPFTGFESTYQGLSVERRIMLTEVLEGPGGEPRDDLAIKRTTGIDPNLVRGLAVPIGARVLIWFPKILPDNALTTRGVPDIRYQWTVEWRMRNVFDHRQEERYPYHYPKQGQGVPDTSGPTPSPRVVIPAANQTTVYTQAEPAGVTDNVAQNARTELYTFGGQYPGVDFGDPVMPGGATGAIQQGILDPATFPGSAFGARSSFYQLIETQAAGDELLIGLTRVAPDPSDPLLLPNWAFGQNPAEFDREVSIFLGVGSTVPTPTGPFPDVGVYVLVGSSP